MSRYLAYRLRQAGVGELRSVVIACHPQSWVVQQLLDEFAFLYPTATVKREGEDPCSAPDLCVVPYLALSPSAIDVSRLRQQLAARKPGKIMLYGVPRRTIALLDPEQVAGYFLRLCLITALSALKERVKAALGKNT